MKFEPTKRWQMSDSIRNVLEFLDHFNTRFLNSKNIYPRFHEIVSVILDCEARACLNALIEDGAFTIVLIHLIFYSKYIYNTKPNELSSYDSHY